MADVGYPEMFGAAAAVVGIVATIVKAMVKPHTDKIESHDVRLHSLEKDTTTKTDLVEHSRRLHSLEKDTATKTDLVEHSRTIIKAIADGNSDIINRIGAVDRKADEAHKRINDQQDEEIKRLRQDVRGRHVGA